MLQEVNALNNNVTKVHYLALHPGTFTKKEDFQLGLVTNWFKKNGVSKPYRLQEIFELTAKGKVFIPSYIECDGNEYWFKSSTLMLLDVDDDEKVKDPEEVLKELKEVCAGLFFTSSHSPTKNRYRLVFVLDEIIRDENVYKSIFKQLAKKLKALNIPVDENANSPLQRVRTATNGYVISNPNATLPVKEFIEEVEKERQKERQTKLKEKIDRVHDTVYSFEELKARAELLGMIEDYQLWQSLAYSLKSYVYEEHITDEEGYEVFSFLCKGDQTKYWDSLKAANRITIGTFIGLSNKKGFKKSSKFYHAFSNKKSPLPIENKKFKQYLEKDFSKELLKEDKKILVKAPTGSGKTSSFIRAAKELAKEYEEEGQTRFFIFSVPTIAITDQVASDHSILSVRGQTLNLFQRIKEYVNSGGRVITCTYDMALVLYDLLQKIKPFASYSLITDEVHELVHNYNFRSKAIDNIVTMQKYVKSFIGLTGTPDDVLREMFEKEVHIQTEKEKAPCQMWGAITYEKKEEEEPLLYQIIKQKASNGKRLLIFLQNKEMIKRLQIQLRKANIKVAIVTSDGKLTNPTYKALIQKSMFPDDVQVILTTSLLSNGVNLKNENANYECILVTSQSSPMFNVDQARQCANRFRNLYKAFYIFMQEHKKTEKHLFNIESAYQYEKKLAGNTVNLINGEFEGANNFQLLRLAKIEKRYGLHYSDDLKEMKFNSLKLRHNVSNEKSQFYALYREQFIQALSKLMMCAPAPTISVSELIQQAEIDLTGIEQELKELKNNAFLDKEAKKANIANHFTDAVYKAFQIDNEVVLKPFKGAVIGEHYSCLNGITPIADYQTCLKVVSNVNRKADANKFKYHIEALTDIAFFNKINRQTATREVFKEFSSHLGKQLTKDEIKDITSNISKKYKRSKKVDVEFILNNYFLHVKERTTKERTTKLEELTLQHVSKIHGIPENQIIDCMENYSKKHSGNIAHVIIKKL